jgi:hypothetical protein
LTHALIVAQRNASIERMGGVKYVMTAGAMLTGPIETLAIINVQR